MAGVTIVCVSLIVYVYAGIVAKRKSAAAKDVEAAAVVSLRKSKYCRQRVCWSSHGFVVAQKWWT